MKYLLPLFIFLCIPSLVFAQTVVRSGNGIAVESDQTIEGDYYVSVGVVGATVMSGVVTGDMHALGGTVTINGTVGGDLGVLAGVAQIHSSIADDVRIVAGEVVVAEDIGGDLFVVAGTLKVLSTASVAGDIIFYGGDAEINGAVEGSIYGSAQQMRIDAPVAHNIDVLANGGLTLGSRAQIAGDVTYTGLSSVTRAQDSVIEGELTEKAYQQKKSAYTGTQMLLIPLFVILFATLTLYLLFRNQIQRTISFIDAAYLKSGLVGMGALLLGPVLATVLMLTVLGFLVGVLVLAATVILYVASIALASVVLGAVLAKFFTKKLQISLLWILLGACGFVLLFFIPFVGPLMAFILISIASGALILRAYASLG